MESQLETTSGGLPVPSEPSAQGDGSSYLARAELNILAVTSTMGITFS